MKNWKKTSESSILVFKLKSKLSHKDNHPKGAEYESENYVEFSNSLGLLPYPCSFCGGKLKSFVEYFKHRKTIHYRPNRQPLETIHTKGKKRKNQDAQRNQEPGINTKIVVHK